MCGDSGQSCQAHATAQLAGAVEDAGCHSGLVGSDPGGRGGGDRSQHQSGTDAGEEGRAEHIGEESAPGADEGEPGQTHGGQQGTWHQGGSGSTAGGDAGRDDGTDDQPHGEGQESGTGRRRTHAQDLLHVEGHEVERRELPGRGQEHQCVRACHPTAAQQAQAQQR